MKEVIKILVVGDVTVGKTTALRRFAQRPAVTKAVPTVALQFYAASIHLAEYEFRLHFWDTSGQKCYWNIIHSHIDEADAALVMYDLTSFQTLHCARQLIDIIYQRKRMPLLLFGNKLDLCGKGQGRQVNNQIDLIMKNVQGIACEGSGFVGQTFEKALAQLLKSTEFDIQNIFARGSSLKMNRNPKIAVVDGEGLIIFILQQIVINSFRLYFP